MSAVLAHESARLRCDLALQIPDLSTSEVLRAAGTVNRAEAGGGLRVCPVHPKHDNSSEGALEQNGLQVLDFIICMDSQAKLKNKT